MSIKDKAANWWAERFEVDELRDQFRQALLKRIPDTDRWALTSDYDPQGVLLDAVRDVVECRGYLCSSDGILPYKTTLLLDDGRLIGKQGYGAPWEVVK